MPPSISTRSHRQGRAIYSHGQNLEISPNPFARAIACSANMVFGSSSRRQPPPVAGLRRRQPEFYPAVAAIASPRRARVWTQSLCYPRLIPSTLYSYGFLPRLKHFYPANVIRRLDEIQIFRVRFPSKPSRTHRVEKLGLTDLAYAIALVTLGLTDSSISVLPRSSS